MKDFIFYADKIMVMGNSKNAHVFNFKSQKFDAHEIYKFYSTAKAALRYVWPVASLWLVSPGAATDGVTLFF